MKYLFWMVCVVLFLVTWTALNQRAYESGLAEGWQRSATGEFLSTGADIKALSQQIEARCPTYTDVGALTLRLDDYMLTQANKIGALTSRVSVLEFGAAVE